jgi:ACS family pantothenate transporter-like MFS transporter
MAWWYKDTFSAWIPLVWFQQVDQPNVTPGNRAAAVVGGLNVIVFTIIGVLAHREKIQKKRDGQLVPAPGSSDLESPSIGEGNEKKGPLVDEKDITPEITY